MIKNYIKGHTTLKRRQPKHFLENHHPDKRPVILLAGWSSHWSFIHHLGDHLAKLGHPVYVVPELKRNLIPIAKSSTIVRELIESHNLQKVCLIAFSKGGLIAKYLMVHDDPDNRIESAITIATPFGGAIAARKFPYLSAEELLPGSSIIENLQKHTSVNKRIIAIHSARDPIVGTSPDLPGAVNIRVNRRGHRPLAFDKEVEAIILGHFQS